MIDFNLGCKMLLIETINYKGNKLLTKCTQTDIQIITFEKPIQRKVVLR